MANGPENLNLGQVACYLEVSEVALYQGRPFQQ